MSVSVSAQPTPINATPKAIAQAVVLNVINKTDALLAKLTALDTSKPVQLQVLQGTPNGRATVQTGNLQIDVKSSVPLKTGDIVTAKLEQQGAALRFIETPQPQTAQPNTKAVPVRAQTSVPPQTQQSAPQTTNSQTAPQASANAPAATTTPTQVTLPQPSPGQTLPQQTQASAQLAPQPTPQPTNPTGAPNPAPQNPAQPQNPGAKTPLPGTTQPSSPQAQNAAPGQSPAPNAPAPGQNAAPAQLQTQPQAPAPQTSAQSPQPQTAQGQPAQQQSSATTTQARPQPVATQSATTQTSPAAPNTATAQPSSLSTAQPPAATPLLAGQQTVTTLLQALTDPKFQQAKKEPIDPKPTAKPPEEQTAPRPQQAASNSRPNLPGADGEPANRTEHYAKLASSSAPADQTDIWEKPKTTSFDLKFDVPLASGREPANIHLSIWPDTEGDTANPEDNSWVLQFAIKSNGKAPVHIQARSLAKNMRLQLWAEDSKFAQVLKDNASELQSRIEAAGLNVGALIIRQGKPFRAYYDTASHMDQSL